MDCHDFILIRNIMKNGQIYLHSVCKRNKCFFFFRSVEKNMMPDGSVCNVSERF